MLMVVVLYCRREEEGRKLNVEGAVGGADFRGETSTP